MNIWCWKSFPRIVSSFWQHHLPLISMPVDIISLESFLFSSSHKCVQIRHESKIIMLGVGVGRNGISEANFEALFGNQKITFQLTQHPFADSWFGKFEDFVIMAGVDLCIESRVLCFFQFNSQWLLQSLFHLTDDGCWRFHCVKWKSHRSLYPRRVKKAL